MKPMIPKGVAQLLARGIRDCYSPEYQDGEIASLSSYLLDLAMTMDCAMFERSSFDCDWLGAIADCLEDETQTAKES